LDSNRYTLGRSSANELCYSDDAGLSRQHLVIEKNGDAWVVRDLNSKNGTFVNGERITTAFTLGPNDRVTAGHLSLEFAEKVSVAPANTVIFVEGTAQATVVSTTASTSLQGLLNEEKKIEGGPQMRALIRAGRELAGNMPLADLFNLIMTLSIEAVGAARGVLMTVEGDQLVVQAARGEGFRISGMVRDRVIKEKTSLLVRDARLDEAFAARQSIVQQQIRSMVAVPLQTDTRVIGLIYLDSPHFVHEFTKDDLNLLTVMANVAAIRIEHTRLAEVEQAERVLARDLQQAAVIQQGLLPTSAPVVPGLDLAGYNAACRTVGGDYYDFLTYPDGRVAMLVGDVAGKGMPAALLMSSLQARVQVLFDDPTNLAALVTRLNRIITTNCPSNRFISFFIAVIDPKTNELVYVNAGHNPPLLVRRDGSLQKLEGTGLILGILPVAQYEQRTCLMESGDVVVLFSDGVTEAMRPGVDEEFGEDRLAEALAEFKDGSAQSIIEAINHRVFDFTGGAPPADDITLVVAKRL
jgi:serine phosphatase RsbU (regulator of sigma subunit)